MCFSPTASFTVGAALSVIGGFTTWSARRTSAMLFASIPLLFGAQQLAEGVIWLSLEHPVVLTWMTVLYLLFSHVLWPTLIPLSVFLMEPRTWRRTILRIFIAIGAIVSLYFLYFLLTETVTVAIMDRHITYVAPHFYRTFLLSPYTVATCASCLFSSHRFINMFGIVMFLSAVIAYRLYEQSFISVWCFFAAVLSVMIYLYVRPLSSGAYRGGARA